MNLQRVIVFERTIVLSVLWFGLVASSAGQAVSPRYPWPAPKYQVRTEKSIMVPMRDGTKLSTDVYFPEGAGDRLPVILIRTPYSKKQFRGERLYKTIYPHSPDAAQFASQGYIVVVQDTRGRFESEGEYTISTPDDQDGYDATTWAAKQPWSNGKVGTYGCSYLGEDQIETAKLRNPALAAMIPKGAGGASRYFGQITGGAVEFAAAVGWFWVAGSKSFLRPPLGAGDDFWAKEGQYFDPGPALPAADYRKMWSYLPLRDIFKSVGAPPTDFSNMFLTPTDFFSETKTMEALQSVVEGNANKFM